MPQSSIDPIVARNLKTALELRGRSAYSVANALGHPSNWLYQVLSEKRGLLIPSLREIARELKISVGFLVDSPENMPETDNRAGPDMLIIRKQLKTAKKSAGRTLKELEIAPGEPYNQWVIPEVETGEDPMTISPNIRHIRGRLAEIGILQADLAAHLAIHESLLNAYLRGRRPMPEGLEEHIHSILNLMERAKRAGQEAERRVMAEGKTE